MKSTRSGRTIKKSTKYFDEDQEFYDETDIKNDEDDFKIDTISNQSDDDEDFKKEMSLSKKQSRKRKSSVVNLTSFSTKYSVSEDPNESIESNSVKSSIQNISIPNPLDYLNTQIALKADPAVRFYLSCHKFLQTSPYTYPPNPTNLPDEKFDETKIIHISKTEKEIVNYDSKLFNFGYNHEKANVKIKEIIGVNFDIRDLKKYSRINSYFLYNLVCKRRAELSGLQISSQSIKEVAKNWTKMPERTRRDWEIKCSKVKRLLDENRRKEMAEESSKQEKQRAALKKAQENLDRKKLHDYNLVDISGYLKASSDSMNSIAKSLKDQESVVNNRELQVSMLDYLLVTCVSLVGLFEENEDLDRPVSTDSLNKITWLISNKE